MKENELPMDRTRHAVYTRNAKRCVQKLLSRYYDKGTAARLWEKIQLQYCEFLKDEPALAGVKVTVSIYDPILIFAWYAVVPDKPPLGEVQQDIYKSFFGSFDALGRIFDLNRKRDNRLAGRIFQKVSDLRVKESERFRRPSAWAPAPMTGKTASSATAIPGARTRNSPSDTTWRMCCP